MNATHDNSHPRGPTVGVGVVVVRGQDVLLIKRGKAPRLGEWSIPGGTQEMGETVRETAVREIQEETGVAIANLKLLDVVDAFRRSEDGKLEGQWTLVDFRADWVSGEACAGGDAADCRWVAATEVENYVTWTETVRIIKAAVAG